MYSSFLFFLITIYVIIQLIVIKLQMMYYWNLILLRNKFTLPYNYSKNKNKGSECPICFDKIKENEDKITTPCLHCFHRTCLERWISIKMIYPVCRQNISSLIEEN